jgi:antitoxin ParD1/3/4/toxin ParE1/3/4
MTRFVLTRPAEQDLDEIKSFLVATAGPAITRRVLKEIRGALNLLGAKPGSGHVRTDLTSRPVKFWPIYSYLVVYDPQAEPIQVIRVLHGMRDVEDILN